MRFYTFALPEDEQWLREDTGDFQVAVLASALLEGDQTLLRRLVKTVHLLSGHKAGGRVSSSDSPQFGMSFSIDGRTQYHSVEISDLAQAQFVVDPVLRAILISRRRYAVLHDDISLYMHAYRELGPPTRLNIGGGLFDVFQLKDNESDSDLEKGVDRAVGLGQLHSAAYADILTYLGFNPDLPPVPHEKVGKLDWWIQLLLFQTYTNIVARRIKVYSAKSANRISNFNTDTQPMLHAEYWKVISALFHISSRNIKTQVGSRSLQDIIEESFESLKVHFDFGGIRTGTQLFFFAFGDKNTRQPRLRQSIPDAALGDIVGRYAKTHMNLGPLKQSLVSNMTNSDVRNYLLSAMPLAGPGWDVVTNDPKREETVRSLESPKTQLLFTFKI